MKESDLKMLVVMAEQMITGILKNLFGKYTTINVKDDGKRIIILVEIDKTLIKNAGNPGEK